LPSAALGLENIVIGNGAHIQKGEAQNLEAQSFGTTPEMDCLALPEKSS
jgi:hypothetical protein